MPIVRDALLLLSCGHGGAPVGEIHGYHHDSHRSSYPCCARRRRLVWPWPLVLIAAGADRYVGAVWTGHDLKATVELAHELLQPDAYYDVEVVDGSVGDDGQPLSHAMRARLVVKAAKAGGAVVRLLDGDPFLYATGSEEAAGCAGQLQMVQRDGGQVLEAARADDALPLDASVLSMLTRLGRLAEMGPVLAGLVLHAVPGLAVQLRPGHRHELASGAAVLAAAAGGSARGLVVGAIEQGPPAVDMRRIAAGLAEA